MSDHENHEDPPALLTVLVTPAVSRVVFLCGESLLPMAVLALLPIISSAIGGATGYLM